MAMLPIGRGAGVQRRGALALTSIVVLTLHAAGCAAHRPARTHDELLEMRHARDAEFRAQAHALFDQLVQRSRERYDEYRAGRAPLPPTVDLLVISGGGDWGAFGAGFLKGWSRVEGPLAKPEFDGVTGVSTGALIAPFAFLGDPVSIETVESLYRNPSKDWVRRRWPIYFLPSNESFATVPGLEREVRARVNPAMIRRLAEASRHGRFLVVNTSDVDDGGMWVWNLGTQAQSAVRNGDFDRLHRILLASAGIPGAFPFQEIDGSLFVDGGVTANILYGGRVREEESFPALWALHCPDAPMPRIRYWLIFNNQLRPLPQVTPPTWPAVVTRSLEMGTRSATLTSMRHLFAQAEVSRLKRGAVIEVRVVSVPEDWIPPQTGTFAKETMNALADLGERMGADPSSWRTEPP